MEQVLWYDSDQRAWLGAQRGYQLARGYWRDEKRSLTCFLYVGQSIAPLYEFNRYCLSVGSTKCGPYGPPPHQQDPTGANTLYIVEWISNKLLSNFVRYPMLHILLFINTMFTAVDPAPSSEEILEQLILPFLSTAHCALSKMLNVHLLVIVCEKRITKDERPF